MPVPAAFFALAVKLCAPGPSTTYTIHAPSFVTFSTVAMCLAPSKISTGREMSITSIVPLRTITPGAVGSRAAPVMASVGRVVFSTVTTVGLSPRLPATSVAAAEREWAPSPDSVMLALHLPLDAAETCFSDMPLSKIEIGSRRATTLIVPETEIVGLLVSAATGESEPAGSAPVCREPARYGPGCCRWGRWPPQRCCAHLRRQVQIPPRA